VKPLVLGIESSCDETAAALVRGGREILSSSVHSQAAIHAQWGGVVPEVAGRSHLQKIMPVIDDALAKAGLTLDDVDAIAVTTKPGLIGSLLIGVSAAKAIAWVRGLPLVGVHHIEAHVYAATMEHDVDPYPCLALVVSGGHTALYRAESPIEMRQLATTRDEPPEKRSTRSRTSSGSVIRAVRRCPSWPRKATPRHSRSRAFAPRTASPVSRSAA
jgi:N6-L-threonylcarbamoyladenine synthase